MTRASTPGSAAATSEKQETTGDAVKAETDMTWIDPRLKRFDADVIPDP
jgi:hypothetical protein